MALGFRKFISEVFVNGKFPKILPSENFPLYGIVQKLRWLGTILMWLLQQQLTMQLLASCQP